MSTRSDIKANLVAALQTITGVGTVTDKWENVVSVDASHMPFIMVISSTEDRERANSQKGTERHWELDVWCYLRPTDVMEDWIESVRTKIMEDRSRGNLAHDCFIEQITCDDQGLATPNMYFGMLIKVDFRTQE